MLTMQPYISLSLSSIPLSHTHTHTHICIHTNVSTNLVCVRSCALGGIISDKAAIWFGLRGRIWALWLMQVWACMCACVRVRVCLGVYVYVCVCACAYMFGLHG
jgi:hypothetical protein